MKPFDLFSSFVQPRCQFILLFFTAICVTSLLVIKHKGFTALEKHPILFPFTPMVIQSWGGDPSIVKVGMNINNFPSFNLTDSDFTLDAIVWFEYDPAHVSTETLGKFSFERGEIVKRSNPDSKKIGNKLLTQYEIRLKFSSALDNTLFPIDQHRIFISLINTYVFPSDIILESDKNIFIVSHEMQLDEWYVTDKHVSYGYNESFLEENVKANAVRYPKVVFSVDFRRVGARKILLIFLPLFLIFFISLFSLAFDPKTNKGEILSLSFGSISSLIGYRFIIQGLSPNVGYFMLSDHVFTILFLLIFIIFSIGVVLIRKGELGVTWVYIRGVILLLSHFIFIFSWYILLFRWVT